MRTSAAIGLLLAMSGSIAGGPCPAPLWTVDLASKYNFGAFSGTKHPTPVWNAQRGVVFTLPDVLVVYHVEQAQIGPGLEQRQADEGGGRFLLRAIFVDARNGNQLRELHWTTTATDTSQLYATHGGRFLVRTGSLLRLYSPDFQQIASMSLPIDSGGALNYTLVEIVPPGRFFFVEHHWDKGRNGPWGEEKSLVDADTLKIVQNPTAADVALWPGASSYFPGLGTLPAASMPQYRRVWQNGNQDLQVLEKRNDEHTHPYKYCAYQMFVGVTYQTWGTCEKVELRMPDARLWWHLEFRDHVSFLRIAGNTLALELDHWSWDPLDLGLPPKPLRIVVYNVDQKIAECSIDLKETRKDQTFDFAVSPDGLLALRLGNELSVYKP